VSPFGHIDLRVRDRAEAHAFYEALLPALGFMTRHADEQWEVWTTREQLPWTQYFGITQSSSHVANENRVAFAVGSREDVERVAGVAMEAGALDLTGPKEMSYAPGYYAIFFTDPCGNRLEVYFQPEAPTA
jgi:predicted enzyme related to lactoylglutathione lyase